MNKYYYDELFVKLNLKYSKDRINLVESPCGSGKSYHCARIINRINTNKDIYYVTDTRMLRESVQKELPPHTQVITYQKLGMMLDDTSQRHQFVNNTEMVFLDEIHQLFRYANRFNVVDNKKNQEEKHYYRIAMAWLYRLPQFMKVIALSATPGNLLRHAKDNGEMNMINSVLDKEQRQMLHRQVVNEEKQVHNMFDYLSSDFELKDRKKALIYTSTIKELKKYSLLLESKGYRVGVLWSQNSKEELSQEQLDLINHLKQYNKLPSDIDVLLINSAYESGWNLENEGTTDIQTICIATSDIVTITQVQNRVRHDIELLVTHQQVISKGDYYNFEWVEKHTEHCNVVLQQYNEKLLVTKHDKDQLAQQIAFLNDDRKYITKYQQIIKVLEKLNVAYGYHDYRLSLTDEFFRKNRLTSIYDYELRHNLQGESVPQYIKYGINNLPTHYDKMTKSTKRNVWQVFNHDEVVRTQAETRFEVVKRLKELGYKQKEVIEKTGYSRSLVQKYWKSC